MTACVVFVGYQPRIYTTWENRYKQPFGFNSACCKYYNSLEDTILAWEISSLCPYIAKEIHGFIQQTTKQKITGFPKPRNLVPFYSELNRAWRAHQKINLEIRNRCIFRRHMRDLAYLIMEQTSKLIIK